ncbi:MAG: DUF2141 domain-containing protein [Alphaproteobacteria bacterium]|tara:strand:+ start:73 stop:498 length:426 start_codon:yes stop_codon:yes gene_type:complete
MKNKISLIVFALYFLNFNVNAGQIKIMVSNIKEKIGTIHFGVYDNPENFLEEDSRILGGYETVEKVLSEGLIIKGLDEATYALAIYHDKNSNNKFDSFLSIPQEMYGFSKNAKVFFGPPKFEDASVFVGSDDIVELNIRLQ